MIYVLGSINMDIVARVERAPKRGETLAAESFDLNQGGKGANQAVAIAKLGGEVAMIGKVGSDAFGDILKESLASAGVDVSRVQTSKEDKSGMAMITVVGGDNSIVYGPNANASVEKKDVDDGLKDAKKGDVLIMQLEIPLATVEYAARLGKEKGMTVVFNPAPAVELDEKLLSLVDLIAPNETETQILTGVEPTGDVEVALAVKALRQKGAKDVLITLGSRGSAVIVGQNITYVPARKVKVVDTTSAGDTFVGAVALKLQEGETLLSAAEFATYASSITIQRPGASQSIPTLEEVQAAIDADKNS